MPAAVHGTNVRMVCEREVPGTSVASLPTTVADATGPQASEHGVAC